MGLLVQVRSSDALAGDPSSFDEVLAQLAADPALRDFARPDAVLLAWTPDGTRLIWASPAAEAVRAALVQDGTGAISPSFPARARLRALGQ